MNCGRCKHWEEDSFSKTLTYDGHIGSGECSKLDSEVEITIDAGFNGGTVRSIETKENFFCAAFEESPNAK